MEVEKAFFWRVQTQNGWQTGSRYICIYILIYIHMKRFDVCNHIHFFGRQRLVMMLTYLWWLIIRRDFMAVIMGMTIPLMLLRNFINGPMELIAWIDGIESYLNGMYLEISRLPSRERSHLPFCSWHFWRWVSFPIGGRCDRFLEGKQPWRSSLASRPRTTGSSLPWQGIGWISVVETPKSGMIFVGKIGFLDLGINLWFVALKRLENMGVIFLSCPIWYQLIHALE